MELLISIGFSALIIYSGGWLYRNFTAFYYNKVKFKNPISRDDYFDLNRYLERDFLYYRGLSEQGKSLFIHRLVNFKNRKRFKGMEGLRVTEEMKNLVSASAIQLTFGLEDYLIRSHDDIYLYPDSFFYQGMKQKMKGGATKDGKILLSWKDLKEGYAIPDDRYNLGLHEMAHALKMNVFSGKTFDRQFANYFQGWRKVVRKDFEKLNNGESTFLREYGAQNMHEFFAVCIEHFFEVPYKMKKEMPELYKSLCVLLNQDVTNKMADYSISASLRKKFPGLRSATARTDDFSWHWSLTILVCGIFSIMIFFILKSLVLINTKELITFLGGLTIACGLLHYKPIIKARVMSIQIYVFYLVIGATPFFANLAFVSNFLYEFGEEKELVFDFHKEEVVNKHLKVTYVYSGDRLPSPFYTSYTIFSYHPINYEKSKLEVRYKTGLLGFRNIQSQHAFNEEGQRVKMGVW